MLDRLPDVAVPQGCSTLFSLQTAHRVKEMCPAMRLPAFNELCDLQINSTCSARMFSARVLRDIQRNSVYINGLFTTHCRSRAKKKVVADVIGYDGKARLRPLSCL